MADAALPTAADGQIAWDQVAGTYTDAILSPLADEMLRGRNPLVRDLRVAGEASVIDFGCGPGRLATALAGRPLSITGVDQSPEMLRRAEVAAADAGIDFTAAQADYSDPGLDLGVRADYVVSINSILPPPPRREQVSEMLAVMARHLAPGGRLLAIMPSHDTTEYLARLSGDVTAHRARHLSDPDERTYADDGANSQCYHDPATIRREVASAGLHLAADPVKVRYPWPLAARHGYGDHPRMPEVWDWYITATV